MHPRSTEPNVGGSNPSGRAEPEAQERWLPFVGFEASHEISDLGRVRSTAFGRILKIHHRRGGYLTLHMSARGKQKTAMIHQAVMAAFVGPPPAGYQVNHKNADKHDARLSNLEYVTPSENQLHADRLGRGAHRWKAGDPRLKEFGRKGGQAGGRWRNHTPSAKYLRRSVAQLYRGRGTAVTP